MLYTAAIMVCLINEPKNYENCQIINAYFKYMTEEQCWSAINGQIEHQHENLFKMGYKLVDAKCTSWLEKKESL